MEGARIHISLCEKMDQIKDGAESGSSDTKDQLFTQRVQSSASSCVSKSDWSKELNPPDFSAEPGLSASKDQLLTQRVQSSASSCVSMKSDWSKELNPPDFSAEPSDTKERKRSGVCVKEQPSTCALCQDVLKDPVSTICGHWFCRQCITSYWDRSAQPGLCSCPQCAERSNSRASPQTVTESTGDQTHVGLPELLDEHQISLRSRCEHVTQGSEEAGSGMLLNRIYTELYITEGKSEEVNTQHEVMQLETPSKNSEVLDVPIRCNDIFKPSLNQPESIRVVLTSGVAGAGKSLSVQKFCLDWANGLENQELSAVIPLSFRELNLIRDQQHSLLF